jgi:diacylglycerol O-acyltransferase / wax synthase
MSHREKISGVDTAWLRMESPSNLMMIVGVMMFRERLSLAKVKQIIEARWLGFRRFKQKAVQDGSGAYWEDDEQFDIANHVHEIALPGKGTKQDLEDLVSDIACTPLDFSKPLWQFQIVDNYQGGSALISRIHHCYADGIALIQVLLSMTAESAAQSLKLPTEEMMPKREQSASADSDFWDSIFKPVQGALASLGSVAAQTSKMGEQFISQSAQYTQMLATDPQAFMQKAMQQTALQMASMGASTQAGQYAVKGIELAKEVAKLATMGKDSPTLFKGPLGVRKRVAWIEPLPLDIVKTVGKAFSASINDVLLGIAAGALREYLAEHGEDVDNTKFRAVVPVNLRPMEKAKNLGNHFGLVFVELPVAKSHPLARIFAVKANMAELKGSMQPVIAFGLLSASGLAPKAVQDQLGALLSQNASTVMTNVPGPAKPLYFAGCEIMGQDFWVPQSGAIGMGLSILSYNGKIHFGVITDEKLVPDPKRLTELFVQEYERLLTLTMMCPWGEDEWGDDREAMLEAIALMS